MIHNGEWIADMSVMPEATVREMVSAAMRPEGDHREKLSPSLAIHITTRPETHTDQHSAQASIGKQRKTVSLEG